MNISGAQVLALIYFLFVVWILLKSALEAFYILRGRTTDRNGNPLWFYKKLDGLPVAAKNRKQALVLTIGMVIMGSLLLVPFFSHHTHQ
jgi:hypothetical protein